MNGFLRSVAYLLSSPLLIATVLLLLALVARLLRRPSAVRACVILAVLVVWLGSTSVVSYALLKPLEDRHPRVEPAPGNGISTVVVLGSGFEPNDDPGSADALDADGLRRILEGMRLATRLDAQLVLSGGARDPRRAPALGYESFVREHNGGTCNCRMLAKAMNTANEARALREALGDQPFVLVTSAYHMPRAMRHMQNAGLHALPAPTGFSPPAPPTLSFGAWLPSSAGLARTERALHEYFGLAEIGLFQAREEAPREEQRN